MTLTDEQISRLRERHDELEGWLAENSSCASEQKHLDAGTSERAYWHHGYKMALEDVLRLLPKETLN